MHRSIALIANVTVVIMTIGSCAGSGLFIPTTEELSTNSSKTLSGGQQRRAVTEAAETCHCRPHKAP